MSLQPVHTVFTHHQFIGICVECHDSVWQHHHAYKYKNNDSTQLMHDKCYRRSLRRDKKEKAQKERAQTTVKIAIPLLEQAIPTLTTQQQQRMHVYIAVLLRMTYNQYAIIEYFHGRQPEYKEKYNIYVDDICTAIQQVYIEQQQQIFNTLRNTNNQIHVASDCCWSHHNYHSSAGFYTCMNTDTQQIIDCIIKYKTSIIHHTKNPNAFTIIRGNYDNTLSAQAMEGIAFDELIDKLQQQHILRKIQTWITDMHTTVGGKFTNDNRLQHIKHILDPPHKYKALGKLLKQKLIT